MHETDENTTIVSLVPCPFGDLSVNPLDAVLGEEEPWEEVTSGLRVSIGNRPVARNLRKLYQEGHSGTLPELPAYDVWDIWIINHTIGVIKTGGSVAIQALGYEADFMDDKRVYTIDILPRTRFNVHGPSLTARAELSAEGHAHIASGGEAPTSVISLGAGASLALDGRINVLGTMSLQMLTPVVQAVGKESDRVQWYLEKDKQPLLGEQTMTQTILVPKGTSKIEFKARATISVKPSFLSFSARYQSPWKTVECTLC